MDNVICEKYALYNGDSCEVLRDLPKKSVGLFVYSPPFNIDKYAYSSDPRDISNCSTSEEFMTHYGYIVKESARLLKAGRMSCVHCMDIPDSSKRRLYDFPHEIIKLHLENGFDFYDRKIIWKDPWKVHLRTNRTMKHLQHYGVVTDATITRSAIPDQVLVFKKAGTYSDKVTHPKGLLDYYGSEKIPEEFNGLREKGLSGKIKPGFNGLSHWIWRRYASSVWMDVEIDDVLPFKPAKGIRDEKHPHPLQLSVYYRFIQLYTNENDIVCEPFMGVGSGPFAAKRLNRKSIGIELKDSYFGQAVKNIEKSQTMRNTSQIELI